MGGKGRVSGELNAESDAVLPFLRTGAREGITNATEKFATIERAGPDQFRETGEGAVSLPIEESVAAPRRKERPTFKDEGGAPTGARYLAKGNVMRIPIPHFLLLAEAQMGEDTEGTGDGDGTGQWRFVLEATRGSTRLEAEEWVSSVDVERLELLAVVRGLEALDQPSRVTLVTSSRYVSYGLRLGMTEWRENEWQWERFGQMTPVKNGDLWRRVDLALRFHSVECRTWRVDRPHGEAATGPRFARRREADSREGTGGEVRAATAAPPPCLRIFRGRRRSVTAWRRWSLSLQWWWRRLSCHGALPAA